MDVLNQLSQHTNGPSEGTSEHLALQDEQGFSCISLSGEMMFAHVSCRPDNGCAMTPMSTCGSNSTKFHHHCLKSTAKCLRVTKHWGITFHQRGTMDGLPNSPTPEIQMKDETIPVHPSNTTESKLICFAGAAHGDNLTKQRLTTGHAMTFGGGAVMC